jgi:diguanylate cyclase (GGDEF)-like protein
MRVRASTIERRFGVGSMTEPVAHWMGMADSELETSDVRPPLPAPPEVLAQQRLEISAPTGPPRRSSPRQTSNEPESRTTRASTLLPIEQSIAPPPGSRGACLVVIYGAELGKRIPVGVDELVCGRHTSTQIPLDDDAVSRHHAHFGQRGSSVVVSDLGSMNGTFVNDASVREHTLQDGDQIKIGHTIFKFFCGANIELRYHDEIYRLMTFDGLTQIQNKRAFETALEREISRSHRYRHPLSLVLFDIDHFKRLNDVHGHLAGDAVLRQLASLVSANLRREDVLARVGGEEFALVLPEIDRDHAAAVAEALRLLVERTPCRFEEESMPITCSFGVAELALDPPMGGTELYKLADERLYAAKQGGRNRVVSQAPAPS